MALCNASDLIPGGLGQPPDSSVPADQTKVANAVAAVRACLQATKNSTQTSLTQTQIVDAISALAFLVKNAG